MKPLHVEVAEALGFTELAEHEGRWWGIEPHGKTRIMIPHYDRSWCSVGPLIDRFNISLEAPSSADPCWDCLCGSTSGQGSTACEAVSKLVVQLHKEGKLPQ